MHEVDTPDKEIRDPEKYQVPVGDYFTGVPCDKKYSYRNGNTEKFDQRME
jgi:hypothetical protein